MTNKFNKILLAFNIIFTSYIVLNLLNKLESIRNGEVFSTVTSMDGMVSELLSFVLCLVIVAIFNLVFNQKESNHKLSHIFIFIISITLIAYTIIFSAGNISYKDLFYLLLSSTLIKTIGIFENYSRPQLFNLFKYLVIYILCMCVYLIVSVNFSDPRNPFRFKDIDQSSIYDDTYISLIYFSIIGILLPLLKLIGVTDSVLKRYKSIG